MTQQEATYEEYRALQTAQRFAIDDIDNAVSDLTSAICYAEELYMGGELKRIIRWLQSYKKELSEKDVANLL